MPEIDVVPAHSRWFRPLASLATAALIVVGLLVPSPAAAAPGNLPSPATATPGNLPATTTADNTRATAPSQITQVMMDGPNQAMYGGPLSYDVAVYGATAGGEIELWIDGTLREKFAFSPSQPQVIPVNNLPAGKHLISVLYPGDSVNMSSSVTRTVTVYEWSSEVAVQTPWPAPTNSDAEVSVAVRLSNPQHPNGGNTPPHAEGTVRLIRDGLAPIVATLTNGRATLAVPATTAVDTPFQVVYEPPAGQWVSPSRAEAHLRFLPTLELTASSEKVVHGTPVVLTAAVTNNQPGGYVEFFEDARGVGFLNLTDGVTSLQLIDLAVGLHSFSARYSYYYNAGWASSGTTNVEVVPWKSVVTTTLAQSEVAVGDATTANVSVALEAPEGVAGAPAAPMASGTVELLVDGKVVGSPVALAAGSAELNVPAQAGGVALIAARFTPAGPTMSAEESAAVRLTTSLPLRTLTVSHPTRVDAGAAILLDGMVTDDGGNPLAVPHIGIRLYNAVTGELLRTIPTGSNDVGKMQVWLAPVPVGSYRLEYRSPATADYAELVTETTFTVVPISTLFALQVSPPAPHGSERTFTAIVVGQYPTGTVTFTTNGGVSVPVPVINGEATFTTSDLAVGENTVTAVYSGDARHAAASSWIAVTVAAWNSAVSMTLSQTDARVGDVVTANVAVALVDPTITTIAEAVGAPVRAASGTVQLLVDGAPVGDVVALVNGVATLPVPTDAVGESSLSARFIPADATMTGATSAAHDLTVRLIEASTTVEVSPTAVHGSDRVIIARVTGDKPTGNVEFSVDGVVVAIAPVTAGVATISTNTLAVGSHAITARYVGDARHTEATASATATVAAWASTVTTILSSADAEVGDEVTVTANVTLSDPNANPLMRSARVTPPVASGTVALLIDGSAVGDPVALADGSATLTLPTTSAGSLSVSVRFVPADASMSAAESTAVTVTVDPVPTPTPTPEPTPTATPEPSPTQSVVPSPTAPMVPSPSPSPAPLAATGTADAGGLLLTALLLIAGALAAGRVARRQRS